MRRDSQPMALRKIQECGSPEIRLSDFFLLAKQNIVNVLLENPRTYRTKSRSKPPSRLEVWPLAGVIDDSSYTKEDLCLQVSDVSHICDPWLNNHLGFGSGSRPLGRLQAEVKFKQSWWVLPNDGMPRIKGRKCAKRISKHELLF